MVGACSWEQYLVTIVHTVNRFTNWTPFCISHDEQANAVDWFYRGDIRFDDPTYGDTMQRCANHPFNLIFTRKTPLDALDECTQGERSLPPAGFLFHLSRCGSTLVSRAFNHRRDTLVLSEAGPINDVLQLSRRDPSLTHEQTRSHLFNLVRALGRTRDAQERHLFIKLDAWNVHNHAAITQTFAHTPSFFLYRDPLEVVVSHLRTESFMMSPANAPATLEMTVQDAVKIPRELLIIRVLARILSAALTGIFEPHQLVNYRELPDAINSRIAPAFGIEIADPDELALLSRYHAKRPHETFTADAEEKQAVASPQLRELVNEHLRPLYDELEARRLTRR